MERKFTMGELAKQAIREGTVHHAGMDFTPYATFERTDQTGYITNYLRNEEESD